MLNSKDKSKNSIRTVRHKPIYNSDSLNNAINRSINDQNFLNSCLGLLTGLNFPTFKSTMVDYIKKSTSDSGVISLFENLDGYIEFKDEYHVRKALEENNPKKKIANQITDDTRQDPIDAPKDHHPTAKSIKDLQAVNESEERKDFPEVTPTAMSEFICKKCGKSYQTPDDLAIHKRFEEGETQYRKISKKSRTDRQRTTPISSEMSPPIQESSTKAVNKDAASKMANLLEGLDFPVTKEIIINHIHGKLDNADKETLDDILILIQNKLQNNVKYNSVHEVEKASKLVVEIK